MTQNKRVVGWGVHTNLSIVWFFLYTALLAGTPVRWLIASLIVVSAEAIRSTSLNSGMIDLSLVCQESPRLRFEISKPAEMAVNDCRISISLR
jgi:hypothetical protein